MKVGFYGHVRQYQNIKSEIDGNIEKVLMSGSYVTGPMLSQYEEEMKEYFGCKYAIGVGNGTDAIWLSLMALGIGEGDEVITHPNTFFATAEAAWIAGCKVDDRDIGNQSGDNLSDVRQHVTPVIGRR